MILVMFLYTLAIVGYFVCGTMDLMALRTYGWVGNWPPTTIEVSIDLILGGSVLFALARILHILETAIGYKREAHAE